MDEDLKKFLKVLEKSKQKARQANDLAEEAKLCNVAGERLAEHRLFERAIEEHKTELRLSESLNDTIAVAISHRKLGECLCELQDFKQALFHQEQYLKLSRKAHNIVEEQRALATIGRTFFQSAVSSLEMIKAQSAFLDSLAVCDKLRDIVKEKELLEMRARLYLNLGLVYNNLKNQKKCMKYIEKALAITVNQSLKDTEYRCHFSLGEIKLRENRPAEALQCFERARKVAQHQGRKFDEADTLVQMGQVLLHLGDFKGAKNILKKCFKTMKHGNLVDELRSSLIIAIKGTRLLEKLQNSEVGIEEDSQMKTYEDLGDLYSSVNCYSKAIKCYLKQLELGKILEKSNQEKAVICVSIAQSFSDNKLYEKAKEYFDIELELREGEPLEQFDTWCNIAEVSELAGDSCEEVEKALNNALQCAKKCEDANRQLHLLRLLSEIRKRLAKYDEDDAYSQSTEESTDDDTTEENNETSKEQSEEQSQLNDDDDDEGDRLIQEEMEFSDSDEEQDDEPSTARSKQNLKSINKRNEKGETVLHVAAIKGDYHLANTSIEKGVSIHERDYCGWQPLHEACNHGNLNIVELLLDRGADINDPGGPHCRGMTPLHDAVQNGHVDVVKLLVARGASVSQRNTDGDTPLDLVLHCNSDDDDDDDTDEFDREISEVREELITILKNATSSGKRQPKVTELRRRDKLQLSDESDEESSQDFSENVSRKTGEISRKRKSALLELDSDDENTPRNSRNFNWNRPKVAKVSKKSVSWLDDENQNSNDGISERSFIHGTGILRTLSNHSGMSHDSVNDLRVQSANSHNSEDVIDLDSDPMDPIPRSSQPSQTDYSDPIDIPQVPRSPLMPGQSHTLTTNHQNLRASSNKNNTSSSSSLKKNTTIPRSIPRTSNTISRTNNTISRTNSNTILRSSTSSNDTIPRTVSRTATMYVDPITGSTQEEPRVSESQPALVPENEYLATATDAWLIDDMPKKTGKRKRSGNILSMLSRSESPRDSSASSRMRSSSDSSRTISSNSDTQRRVPQASTQRGPSTNTSGNRTRLRQTRLNVVSGRSSPNEFWDNTPPEPATTSLSSGITAIPDASPPMRLRVKVKEKMFLIPCPSVPWERKTVKWLAEQATFRYHSATGLKPILSLFTTEGAALSPDDLITDVLSNNEQVNATVETWDLPPLAKRYEEACVMADTDVHQAILNVFERYPHISNVEFKDMSLTPVTLRPLFRALQCHDQLVRLALSGNRMCDDGLQYFISSLPCLSNISVLILNCNGITQTGLRNLASSLTRDDKISKAWSNLKELDVSFNTIEDNGSSSLATMLRLCPDLQILNLESCGLSQNTFHQRSTLIEAIQGLRRLHHLNVSHNQIPSKGLLSLLSACSSVEIVNISSTVQSHDPAFAPVLANYLDEINCCVKSLICRGCFFNDKDVRILTKTVKVFKSGCKLDLGQNKITNEGVLELVRIYLPEKYNKNFDVLREGPSSSSFPDEERPFSRNVEVLVVFFRALKTNRNFKHLNLSGNVEITNESLVRLLTLSSNLQHLDLSSCGVTSPLPTRLINDKVLFPLGHLKHLNLSHNSLNGQDIGAFHRVWSLTWREQSHAHILNSTAIFSVRGYND